MKGSAPTGKRIDRASHLTMLSERLRVIMGRRGMERSDLAAGAGVHEATIRRVLNGERGMQTLTFAAICQCLGCSADYLLGLSDESGVDVVPHRIPTARERPTEDGWLP